MTWSRASPCTSTFFLHAAHHMQALWHHSNGEGRTHAWEKLLKRARGLLLLSAQPGNHRTKLLYVYWKSLHLYRPSNSLLGCLQNPTEKREMGRGKKESEKLLCSQGKKNKQPYLAYPALLMSITFLILNRKDTTLVHLFHYLSCYVFPMNCHSCKPVHRKGTP